MKKCISFRRLNFETCIQFGCKTYQRTLKKRFLFKKNTFPEDSACLTCRPWPAKSISLKTHLLDVLKIEQNKKNLTKLSDEKQSFFFPDSAPRCSVFLFRYYYHHVGSKGPNPFYDPMQNQFTLGSFWAWYVPE